MSSRARMTFSNGLVDLNQPASIKVIETDGKLQLCITLGLKAQKVPNTEPGDPVEQRDAIINNEVLMTGRAKIALKRPTSPLTPPSQFSVTFDGDLDTKVPGTGDEAVLMEFISENGHEPS